MVAVGDDVTEFKVGDKIAPSEFLRSVLPGLLTPFTVIAPGTYHNLDTPVGIPRKGLWYGLGNGQDGTARDYMVVDQDDAVKIPEYMSFKEVSNFSRSCYLLPLMPM